MITDADLAPGTRVPERPLCMRFGVRRTPLREALKALASEGLRVVLGPKRAMRVRLFD